MSAHLTGGIATGHEILVVCDFDEDPTVRVIEHLHAEQPTIRGLRIIDSRFELFPPDLWDDYRVITGGGADATAVLDRWQVDALVVPAGQPALAGAWRQVYGDGDGSLFIRSDSATP